MTILPHGDRQRHAAGDQQHVPDRLGAHGALRQDARIGRQIESRAAATVRRG